MPTPSPEVLLEHALFVRRLARSLLRDEQAADDVTQETMLVALDRPPRRGNLRSWLGKVARNLALTRLRGERRRAARERRASKAERLPSVDEGLARLELQRRVVEAVLALEEPYRSVIVHRFFYELSLEEIASRLRTPLETVRTRQRRALDRLRSTLDREQGGGRQAWSVALLALAVPARAGTPSAIAAGVIAMASKLKITVLALVVAAGLLLVATRWFGSAPEAPTRAPAPAVETSEQEPAAPAEPAPLPPPVDFARLDRDLDLHGVVVDAAGSPVAGAEMVVMRQPFADIGGLSMAALRQEEGPRSRTARDGTFALRLLRGEEVGLRVKADGFAPLERRWCQSGARVRIVMRKGVRLLVRATDEGGGALAGVSLLVWKDKAADAVEARGNAMMIEGTTGPRGVCAFEDLVPGGRHSVLAWHPRLSVQSVRPFELPETGQKEVTVRLERGREITGFVTDAVSGEPLEGATVAAVPAPVMKTVETADDGRFVYGGWGAEAQQWGGRLYAWAEEHALASAEVGERTRIDFALHLGDRVTGRLVDAAGSSVAGAYVAAGARERRGGPDEMDWRETRSDESGTFRLRGLRRDLPHTLLVLKPGFGRYLHAAFPPVPKEAGTIDLGEIVLPAARAVEGRALGPRGDPLAGIAVELRRGERGALPAPQGARHERRTDDLGRFRFRDVAPGAYGITVTYPDGRTLDRRLQVPEDKDLVGLEFRYAEGDEIPVLVVDVSGSPVAGVLVIAGRQRKPTGRDGRVTLKLPPGARQTQIYVSPRSKTDPFLGTPLPIDYKAGQGELRIVLSEAATISGTVVGEDGRPMGGVAIRVTGPDGWSGFAATSREGAFSARVPKGERLRLHLDGQTQEGWKPIAGELTDVAAGSEGLVLRARTVATDRTLRVRVTVPDGSGVPGVACNVWPLAKRIDQQLLTDQDGRIDLSGLPAMEVGVSIHMVDLRSDPVRRWAMPSKLAVRVLPNGQEVVFAFREPNPIRGTLLLPDGKGTASVVLAYRGENDLVARAMSDPDGSFTLNIPAGEPAAVRLVAQAGSADGRHLSARVEGVRPGTDGVTLTLAHR